MANELQDVDLAGYTFDISDINNAFFLQDLYCNLLASKDVCAELDLSKSPLADGLPEDVVPDRLGSAPPWDPRL
jgi:hypothetical protein